VRGAALTEEDRLRRDVIERLMCDLEVDLEAAAAAHEADSAELVAAAVGGLPPFVDDGLASWDGRRIAVSPAGRPFVRSIASLFDAYLDRASDKPRHARAV
jgi:oxygen-independent coproporphyrinogen-3 oxidase